MPRATAGFHQALLGKIVRPNPLYYSPDNSQLPWPFKANLSDERFATIVAVWVDDGSVRLALRGPDGSCSDKVYLAWVLVDA